MAANRIALQRAERKIQAEAWRGAVARWDSIEVFSNQLLAGVKLVMSGTLLAAGFHQASRHQWRKRQHA